MIVYLVIAQLDYEASMVMGVCSSKKDAQQQAKQIVKGWDSVTVEAHKVDDWDWCEEGQTDE